MKILMINTVCGIGSTGRICTDLADILSEQGNICKIAYGREQAPDKYKKYAYKIGKKNDTYIHALLTRITDRTGFYSTKATKKFIEWIKQYNPDIIHLHNIHGYYINIELLFEYLKDSGKPVVWTLHDCWAFTGHCPYFDLVNCERWKGMCYNCPAKSEYPKSYFLDNSKKNYLIKKELFTSLNNLTIITPSKWLADLAKQSFLSKYPVKVINNGIDLGVFTPTEGEILKKYNIKNKKIVLGVANVWSIRKGFNDFISLRKLLDNRYIVILVGVSKKQQKSLPEGIVGIRRTDNVKQLVEIYTSANVFVNPTREENYPTVNMEALACGTPVITYNTGGSPETINDLCGAVVEKGNITALKEEIEKICFSKKDCINQASLFDKQTKYNEYIELYKEILK